MTTELTSLSFMTTSVVEIIVGKGDKETLMKPHQGLLMQVPFFAELLDKLEEPVS